MGFGMRHSRIFNVLCQDFLYNASLFFEKCHPSDAFINKAKESVKENL